MTEERAYNRAGDLIWTLQLTTPTTGHYTDKRGYIRSQAGSGAAYVDLTWSAEGFRQEYRFRDRNGKPQPNEHGVFGVRQELDEGGLPLRKTWLDADDHPMLSKYGFAGWTATYNALGEIVASDLFDRDGKPTLNVEGYSRVTIAYDDSGNLSGQAYFDRDGKPTLHKDGYSSVEVSYDEHGDRTRVTYLDRDGKPTLHKQGYAGFTQRTMREATSLRKPIGIGRANPRCTSSVIPACSAPTTTTGTSPRKRTWTATASRRRTATASPGGHKRTTRMAISSKLLCLIEPTGRRGTGKGTRALPANTTSSAG